MSSPTPVTFDSLVAAVEYVQAARLAVHNGNCPVPNTVICSACVPFHAAAEALDILRAANGAPSSCLPARLVLHDAQCVSGCKGEQRDDHAKRHIGAVRELRRFVRGKP